MIQIKADAAIKAAFNKAISVMGADVEWCEIFVINNNSIILPGKRRSLVFSFDNRKLINTIIDVDVNVDSAILMCNNTLLENAFNILLYIFGKWNQIKGLTVGQNYKQLKSIVDNVFSEIRVTSEIAKDKCRFYKDGIQILYEDVIQLIIDKMLNINRDNTSDKADEDVSGDEEDAVKDRKKNRRNKMGLWHNMKWKSDERSFKYNGMSKKERNRKRLGRGFYASAYQCPICGGVMYMTVYAAGQEQKIETDEGNVYLARAYTCDECTVFFTPRPDRLLAEGIIYKLDFDGDEQAYNDYIDVMGKDGQRVSNCNFNVYEQDYEKKSQEEIDEEEKQREATDKRMLSDVCDNIKEHPDAEIFQLNARMDADFYSQNNVKKYGGVIEKETKRRNLLAGDIKRFFKEHFELDSRKKYGNKNKKNKNIENNKNIEKIGHGKPVKESIETGNPVYNDNQNIEKTGHDKQPQKKDTDDNILDLNKKKKRKENKEHLKNILLKGDDRQFIMDTAVLPADEIRNFTKDIQDDNDINEDTKKKYIELSDKIIDKKQEKKIAQKLLEVKSSDYNTMTHAYRQIEEEDCSDNVKEPLLKKLFSWITAKKKEELDEIIESVPEYLTRKKYNELKDKIHEYSDIFLKDRKNNDIKSMDNVSAAVNNDNAYPHTNTYKNNADITQEYKDRLDNMWKESQIKCIKNILNNADNSIRDIYDILSGGEFDDEYTAALAGQYHDKLVKQDTITIQQLCPDLADMTFDEAVQAYNRISEQILLPELKTEILGNIIEHLDNLKKDECRSLIEKLKKDMEYDDGYIGLYMYNIGDESNKYNSHGYEQDKEITNVEDDADISSDESNNPYPVENALYTYVDLSRFEYPIAICDTSRLSNGKKGFVLTPDNIYYSCGMSSGVLEVRNIQDIYTDKGLLSKGIYVDYAGNGKIKISSIPEQMEQPRLQHFMDCLREYIEYLKEKPLSRSIEYLAETQRDIICCIRCGYIFDANNGNVCPKCGNVNEV